MNHPLSTKNVVNILEKKKLLSQTRAEEIYAKRRSLINKLESLRKKKVGDAYDSERIKSAATIIDVIASLNIKRNDDPSKPLDEDKIFETLSSEWGIAFKKIDPVKLDLNVVTTTIPKTFAMKHIVLPLAISGGQLVIATPDPFNTEVFHDITRACGMPVKTVVSSKSDIIRLINEFFGFKRSIAAAEDQFSGPSVDLGNLERYVKLKSIDDISSNDHHIVNAVNHLFLYAFDQKASDIHIEPKRETSLVRLRIDGVLHTVYKLPKNVHKAIVSRIKNLSGLDMAEKRKPQDGRIKTEKEGNEVEIRLSTIPVAFGEKIVMRIMDPDILFQDFQQLGFTGNHIEKFNTIIQKPHGIVLVCGPTGSGKSTTLYSTLRSLYSPALNITTIEDPIEMVHEEFNQIAIRPQVGITFGSILRNILRQDPDIIMIGEMRDLETAENAIQAALTGHLVLSTLHTNDAPSSIIRLIDLGVPPFLIQATLGGILAQRLVRKICPYCNEAFSMDVSELDEMGIRTRQKGSIDLVRGKGCQRCRGTGYLGRTGIHEILPYTEPIKRMTTSNTDLEGLTSRAKKEGMQTLRESAVDKLLSGITTYQEVLRVTWEST